jgi:hypothetical protein
LPNSIPDLFLAYPAITTMGDVVSIRFGADMPADVEQPALRASLRAGLLLVIEGVEAFVLDDGTAR